MVVELIHANVEIRSTKAGDNFEQLYNLTIHHQESFDAPLFPYYIYLLEP